MNEHIYLSFHHLTVLFAIIISYGACVSFLTSAIIKSLGWQRPYSETRKQILQWAPALLSALFWGVAGPFVYSLVVMPVSGLEWHLAAAPVGFMAGLVSKPAYYILKKRIGPAWVEGTEKNLRNG